MNKIKNSYRVDTPNILELENKFTSLISNSIEFNRLNDENKKLIAISIRVSYKSTIDSKKIYHTLLTKNIDIENFKISGIINKIKDSLEKRHILPEKVTSLHIHFYYL